MVDGALLIVAERRCKRNDTLVVLQAEADMIREPMLVVGVQVKPGTPLPEGFVLAKPSAPLQFLQECPGHELHVCKVVPSEVGLQAVKSLLVSASAAAWVDMDCHADWTLVARQICIAACRSFSSVTGFEMIVKLFGENPNLHITPDSAVAADQRATSIVFFPEGRVRCSVCDCYNVVQMGDIDADEYEPPSTWMSVHARAEGEMVLNERSSVTSSTSGWTMMFMQRLLHIGSNRSASFL